MAQVYVDNFLNKMLISGSKKSIKPTTDNSVTSEIESLALITAEKTALVIGSTAFTNAIVYSVCVPRCQSCLDIDEDNCVHCNSGFNLNSGKYCDKGCHGDQIYSKALDKCEFKCYTSAVSSCQTCFGATQYDCLTCFDAYELKKENNYCVIRCQTDTFPKEYTAAKGNQCQIPDCFNFDIGFGDYFNINNPRFDRLRVQSACATFEKTFNIPKSATNRNLAAIDWNQLLWDKRYFDISIKGMNARVPGHEFLNTNDFTYIFMLLTPNIMELNFKFHPEVKPLFNSEMKIKVDYTLNATHLYSSEFLMKANNIPLSNETISLVESLDGLAKVLKFVVNSGWVTGLFGLLGGVFGNLVFLLTIVNVWNRVL